MKIKTTEKCVRLLELENKIVVEVARNMKKDEIKKQIEELFSVKVDSIKTYIKGNKKTAYVKLAKENLASDLASKFGVI